jgi:peptidoglycan/xylan/chitin deacetylase (PgdA/CDA1 family)
VALTFDDGPNPPRTEQVLEILAQAQVRATFFVMGKWAERFPRSVERLIAAGHVVGNHGYSGQGWIGDYDQAEAVIGHIMGKPSRYLRPHTYNFAAYFESKVSRLSTSYTIGCDVNSQDWDTTDPDTIVANVLDHSDLGPGSIINLHDGAEYEEAAIRLQRPVPMLTALPRIIEGLMARQLVCAGLDEMEWAEPVVWEPGERLSDLQRKVAKRSAN